MNFPNEKKKICFPVRHQVRCANHWLNAISAATRRWIQKWRNNKNTNTIQNQWLLKLSKVRAKPLSVSLAPAHFVRNDSTETDFNKKKKWFALKRMSFPSLWHSLPRRMRKMNARWRARRENHLYFFFSFFLLLSLRIWNFTRNTNEIKKNCEKNENNEFIQHSRSTAARTRDMSWICFGAARYVSTSRMCNYWQLIEIFSSRFEACACHCDARCQTPPIRCIAFDCCCPRTDEFSNYQLIIFINYINNSSWIPMFVCVFWRRQNVRNCWGECFVYLMHVHSHSIRTELSMCASRLATVFRTLSPY